MEKIHVSNRAQLLDDAFVLAGTNITLTLAEYLRHETEYEPWVVIINRMIELIETIKRRGEKEAAASLKVDKHFNKNIYKNTFSIIRKKTFLSYFKDKIVL